LSWLAHRPVACSAPARLHTSLGCRQGGGGRAWRSGGGAAVAIASSATSLLLGRPLRQHQRAVGRGCGVRWGSPLHSVATRQTTSDGTLARCQEIAPRIYQPGTACKRCWGRSRGHIRAGGGSHTAPDSIPSRLFTTIKTLPAFGKRAFVTDR